MNITRELLLLVILASVVCRNLVCPAVAQEKEVDEPQSVTGVILLQNGDTAEGLLQNHPTDSQLKWQSPLFDEAFQFDLEIVRSLRFPTAKPRDAEGEFSFELAGGDVLYGNLKAADEKSLLVAVPGSGNLRVRKQEIRRIESWSDGNKLLYVGPGSSTDWQLKPPAAWAADSGHLATSVNGAVAEADINLEEKTIIELELSWTANPDFLLSFGVDDQAEVEQAFQFEVWSGKLILLRELPQQADLEPFQTIDGAGRSSLKLYLDQIKGRAILVSQIGQILADISLPADKPVVGSGIRLLNKRGSVTLERIRVNRWDGTPPAGSLEDRARIHRRDGTVVYGDITSIDQEEQALLVKSDDREIRVPLSDAGAIYLPGEMTSEEQPLQLTTHHGVRISGSLMKVEDDRLWLQPKSCFDPVGIPLVDVHSLEAPAQRVSPQDTARLVAKGLRLHGKLSRAIEDERASCLGWKPTHGTAARLRKDVSARVIFRERTQPVAAVSSGQVQRGFFGEFSRLLARASRTVPQPSTEKRVIHLRSGDRIPGKVLKIDERGVEIETSVSDASLIPHDRMKAVVMNSATNQVRVTRAKQERLLTLPRIQRDNPPTHLIRSTRGDFLRVRLDAMDERELHVEVRLNSKKLPRTAVSQIIWLHEEELETGSGYRAVERDLSDLMCVQVHRTDGIRLTFHPISVSEEIISGDSDVLGACHVELSGVDQILIGAEIDQGTKKLVYHDWRLRHAPEPRYLTVGGSDGQRKPGTASAMVGSPAPDFKLPLLDGRDWRLSEHRGKVVVLDFWATWCGPCIQAMPEVDRIVGEFEGDVELIAVNLQEQVGRIRSTLKRLKLEPIVVLDRDGAVAQKYTATAIPQTVIIDREGVVARLFVGGGSEFPDQFREALEDVVGETSAEE